MSIRAEDWNATMDELRQNLPLSFVEDTRGGWRHPWNIAGRWDEARGVWLAQIHPGFVNGGECEVIVPNAHAPAETIARIKAAGGKYLAAELVAYLTESPELALTGSRLVGAGGDSGEKVPPFFAALGVGEAQTITVDLAAEEIITTPAETKRYLRACDIVLHKDRLYTETEWHPGIAGVDDSALQFDIVYKATARGSDALPYIRVLRKYEPPVVTPAEEVLKGATADTGVDSLLIGTAYMLSPEGAREEDPPGADWAFYAAHNLFWNLSYGVNISEKNVTNNNITFPLTLAGGVAQTQIQAILTTINDNNDAIAEFLAARTVAGRFWTT